MVHGIVTVVPCWSEDSIDPTALVVKVCFDSCTGYGSGIVLEYREAGAFGNSLHTFTLEGE